jgi:hypothetical protein
MFPLRLAVWCVAALSALPLLVVLSSFAHPEAAIWQHLVAYVLPQVLLNTLLLCGGVLAGVLLLGVSLAWLVTQYQFPGSRVFRWALMLPLAVPAYVMAFVQVGLLDFTGPVQESLRAVFGADLRLPAVRSLGGAVLVLSLSFYPYVYLLGAQCFCHAGQSRTGGGAVTGFIAAASTVARGAALGTTVDCGGLSACHDGNAGRFWRGVCARHRYFHHGHLQGVVCPIFATCRQAVGFVIDTAGICVDRHRTVATRCAALYACRSCGCAAQAIANTGVVGSGWLRLRAAGGFHRSAAAIVALGLAGGVYGFGQPLPSISSVTHCCWRC